jgi:hypothetical protein
MGDVITFVALQFYLRFCSFAIEFNVPLVNRRLTCLRLIAMLALQDRPSLGSSGPLGPEKNQACSGVGAWPSPVIAR